MIGRELDAYKFCCAHLKILVLGSYEEPNFSFLEELCRGLKELGFKSAELVRNFDTPLKKEEQTEEEYFYIKSCYWIDRVHCWIAVLFGKEFDCGTGTELGYIFSKHEDRLEDLLIIIKEGIKASRVLIGQIDYYRKRLTIYHFKNLKEALEYCTGFLINVVANKCNEIVVNTSYEWAD